MRCRLSNREVSFICLQNAAAAAAAAAALCVAILLLLLQQQCLCFLLLFVIVCRRAKFVAVSLNLIPVFYFSSFIRDLFLMVPLGSAAVSHLRPRFAYILGNYGHARSQGGRQPVAAKPPLYIYKYVVSFRESPQPVEAGSGCLPNSPRDTWPSPCRVDSVQLVLLVTHIYMPVIRHNGQQAAAVNEAPATGAPLCGVLAFKARSTCLRFGS